MPVESKACPGTETELYRGYTYYFVPNGQTCRWNQRPALGQTQSCIVVKPVNLFLTVTQAGGIKDLPWDSHKVVSLLNLLICS
jgi:hypothetical protein